MRRDVEGEREGKPLVRPLLIRPDHAEHKNTWLQCCNGERGRPQAHVGWRVRVALECVIISRMSWKAEVVYDHIDHPLYPCNTGGGVGDGLDSEAARGQNRSLSSPPLSLKKRKQIEKKRNPKQKKQQKTIFIIFFFSFSFFSFLTNSFDF